MIRRQTETRPPKRIRWFYGWGKFADGYNFTIICPPPAWRVKERRRLREAIHVLPIDFLHANTFCGFSPLASALQLPTATTLLSSVEPYLRNLVKVKKELETFVAGPSWQISPVDAKLLEVKKESSPTAAPLPHSILSPGAKTSGKPAAEPALSLPRSECNHDSFYQKPTCAKFGTCMHCGYNCKGGDPNHHFIMQCGSCIFTACRRCYTGKSWQ